MQTASPISPLTSIRTWFAAVVLIIMSEPAQTADSHRTIVCAQTKGQVMSECKAIISLDENESGTIVVTFKNGFSRTLYIKNGAFIRANPTMSGTGRHMKWKLEDNMYFISVDGQHFAIERSALTPR